MATLTAWAFNSVDGAEQASQRLQALQSQELIKIQDAAVVSWEEGKKKPKTRQLSNMTASRRAWWHVLGHALRIDLLRAAARCCDRRGHRRPGRLDDRRRHRVTTLSMASSSASRPARQRCFC